MTPLEIERAMFSAQFGLLAIAAGELTLSSKFAGIAFLLSALYLEKVAIHVMRRNGLFSGYLKNEAAANHLSHKKSPVTSIADNYVTPALFQLARTAKTLFNKAQEAEAQPSLYTRVRTWMGR